MQENWEMIPVGGATGHAYMGYRNGERVFIKVNSSPFIAALSAEGIAPKLMWTQRSFSGDILTAQEWKDGTLLSANNMSDPEVVAIIYHIHHSDYLLTLLKKARGEVFGPEKFIQYYLKDLPNPLKQHHTFNQVVQFLQQNIDDDFYQLPYVVCHGDLNHNNFLRCDDHDIYLVDWENVRIADPLSDITQVLCQYFQPSQWGQWLNLYGFHHNKTLFKRVQWYSLMNCLLISKHYYKEQRYQKMNKTVQLMRNIYEQATHSHHKEYKTIEEELLAYEIKTQTLGER